MCWRSNLTAAAFQNRTTTSNTDKLPKVFYMPQVHSTGQEYQLAPGPFRRVGGTVVLSVMEHRWKAGPAC